MSNKDTFSIRMVTTLAEFEMLAEDWNALLGQTSTDEIFLTWEWVYTWSKHYLGKNRLYILLVYKGEYLVGIAPFYIGIRCLFGLISVKELRFLATGEVCSVYLDFIVPEKKKKAVLPRIYHYLYNEGKEDWDLIILSKISACSTSIDYLCRRIQEEGKVVELISYSVCPVINLPCKIENFLSSIAGSERYNLRRRRERLKEAGGVVCERITTSRDIEKGMTSFIQLHEQRWGKKGSGGSFQSAHFTSFHKEVARVFSERGWVRLDFMMLDGEKIAGSYGFVYRNRYSYYLPGFDPERVPKASPGRLLLFHCIEEAIKEEFKEFDLLLGWSEYKMAWASGIKRLLTIRHYNRTFSATLMKLVDSVKETIKILVR